MKKIIIPAAVVFVAVVTAVVVFVVNQSNKYRLVKIKSYEGEVVIDRDGEDTDVFDGMKLIPDDTVSVLEKSFLELLCDNDKHICAEENTSFVIDSDGDEKDGYITIELLHGKALFTIDNKLPEDSSFDVKTPNATLSVRGTEFSVEYNPDTKETTVEVFEGKVWALNNDEETILEKGDKTVFKNNGSKPANQETTAPNKDTDNENPQQTSQQKPDNNVDDSIQYMYFYQTYNYDFSKVDIKPQDYSELDVYSFLKVVADDFSGFYNEGYYSTSGWDGDVVDTLNQQAGDIFNDYLLPHEDEIYEFVTDYDELTIQRLEQNVLTDTYTKNVTDWFPENMILVMPLSEGISKLGNYDITHVEMNVNLKDTTDLSEAEKSISGYHLDKFGTYWYVDGVCFTFYGS